MKMAWFGSAVFITKKMLMLLGSLALMRAPGLPLMVETTTEDHPMLRKRFPGRGALLLDTFAPGPISLGDTKTCSSKT